MKIRKLYPAMILMAVTVTAAVTGCTEFSTDNGFIREALHTAEKISSAEDQEVLSGDVTAYDAMIEIDDEKTSVSTDQAEGTGENLYPVIAEGTLEECGIPQGATELIDRIISADIENGFSSAQLAIIKDEKLVYKNAWGNVRTWDENGDPITTVPVTCDTLYDLASNTKMYSVNYAIQYLLTKGDIDIYTKIADILGDAFFEDTIKIDYVGYPEVSLETNKLWKAELTLRDLMKHQGGFPASPQYFNDGYDQAQREINTDTGNIIYVGTAGDEAAREETLKALFKTPLMYEPGSDTLYSDADYMILCYCIEKLTGKTMDEYLKEVFWDPMGLTHITYNPLQHGFEIDDCAATELMGNSRDGKVHYTGVRTGTIQGEVHDPNAFYCMAGISGHAGLFSNAEDLAKLGSVMLTGGYGDREYFSKEVIDLFTTSEGDGDSSYGLGWYVNDGDTWDRYFGSETSEKAFGHQGFTGTLTMIDPDNDLVIVLLTNKIHSKIMDNDKTLNRFKGNYYTTGTLGFVPKIIEVGIRNPDADDELWKNMISDMVSEAQSDLEKRGITDEDHPKMRAYRALLSVEAQY